MSAVLALSAAAVATDGKTLTATISGGTGTGYALSSATGIAPHLVGGNAYGLAVASASVAGSTLTVNVTTPFGSGESVQLDFPSSVTLTDSGANTPTGQTNLAVTNNSTVTVTTVLVASVPGSFELNGLYPLTSGAIRGNAPAVASGVSDSSVEWVTDATEVATLQYSGGTSQIAVDGATSFTTITGSGFWSAKAATTSALSAGKHLFRLAMAATDYFYGVRLSGGTRTMYAVNTTKQTLLTNTATYLSVGQTTNVKAWATYKITTAGQGICNLGQNYTGLRLELGFTGTGVEVLATTNINSKWAASVDGGFEGALLSGGDATVNNVTAVVPLALGASAGSHTLRATFVSSGVGTDAFLLRVINGTMTTASSAITDTTLTVASTANLAVNDWVRIDSLGSREWRQITGIAGSVITVAALAKVHATGAQVTSYSATAGSFSGWIDKDESAKRMVAVGDSNTQGANAYGFAGTPDANGVYYSPYDPRTPMAYQLGQALSMELVNLGIQGTNTVNQAGRAADIGTYGRQAYDYVLIWEGTNDINGGGVTPAQYGTNVQTQITAAKVNLRANGKVILIPPGTPYSVTSAAALNIAACASQLATLAAADPTNVLFASGVLSNLIAPTDYSDGGGGTVLHFSPSGQAKIAANLIPFLSGLLGGTGMFFAA